jgi:biopolymer transport protein TolR
MGMSGGGGSRAVPYINVTPLIDVLLVLLIIFMVVTPLKPKRFKTLIPEQQQGPPPQDVTANNLTLRVDILKDNTLQLNQEPIGTIDNTSRLSATLADLLRKREEQGVYKFGTNIVERTVFIKAPESKQYGDVVKVIDAIKGAGADPVGLQVDALEP